MTTKQLDRDTLTTTLRKVADIYRSENLRYADFGSVSDLLDAANAAAVVRPASESVRGAFRAACMCLPEVAQLLLADPDHKFARSEIRGLVGRIERALAD